MIDLFYEPKKVKIQGDVVLLCFFGFIRQKFEQLKRFLLIFIFPLCNWFLIRRYSHYFTDFEIFIDSIEH